MDNKWVLKDKYSADFAKKLPGFHPVILQLLYNRGLLDHKAIDEFLNPDYTGDLHDPFLFNDMKKVVDRILKAIEKKEKILIYGDYDADGVTASAVLEKTLFRIGAPHVEVYIPHRARDGYGLHAGVASELKEKGISLVITVDNGITAFEGADKLRDLGVDLIITDHHLPLNKHPHAFAIVDPNALKEKYPFKKLAGVGVAFKVSQALFSVQKNKQDFEAFEKWLLDLVSIGTIGDVSLILGENRTLVKYGLMVLNKTTRRGLQELIKTAKLDNGLDLSTDIPLGQELYDLSVRNVAFQIVPRLNAAGRIDHAETAFKLLQTQDEMEAIALASDIAQKNLDRQKQAEEILKDAEEQIGEVSDDKKILIAESSSWNGGIVGLVCGKLKDKYNRPVILFARDGDKYVGSSRSVLEFNLVENFEKHKKFLERYGGHAVAAGATIEGEENFEAFKKAIEKTAKDVFEGVELVPTIELEVEVGLNDLNWDLLDELEKLEPFAEGNPQPLFLLRGVKIEDMQAIGKTNSTLRFMISSGDEGTVRKAISFGKAGEWQDKLKKGDLVDVVVEFGVNEWNGNRELQLKVIDWRK